MSESSVKQKLAKMQFWKRNKRSANITALDPTFRVVYLGNVLTSFAKGSGCADKPLCTLWRNHLTSEKSEIIMRVSVSSSGLKAITKEHGLTEYWAGRITHCQTHTIYPKMFCWIYRHEGRRSKQELRCHAVLCSNVKDATHLEETLNDRLRVALRDFRAEKIARQNARLSLANSVYERREMPYRRLLLQTGSANYKPPVERAKSAPKLGTIEEEDDSRSSVHFEEESREISESAVGVSLPEIGVPDDLCSEGDVEEEEILLEYDTSEDESGEGGNTKDSSPAGYCTNESSVSSSKECSPGPLIGGKKVVDNKLKDCSPNISDYHSGQHPLDCLEDKLTTLALDQDNVSDESGYSERILTDHFVEDGKNNLIISSVDDSEEVEPTSLQIDMSVQSVSLTRDFDLTTIPMYKQNLTDKIRLQEKYDFCINI